MASVTGRTTESKTADPDEKLQEKLGVKPRTYRHVSDSRLNRRLALIEKIAEKILHHIDRLEADEGLLRGELVAAGLPHNSIPLSVEAAAEDARGARWGISQLVTVIVCNRLPTVVEREEMRAEFLAEKSGAATGADDPQPLIAKSR